MWPELREEVELELAILRQHLETFAPARARANYGSPDPIEKAALGAMLHGFYGGVENIFKRIALHCDGGPPGGQGSHAALLDQVGRAGSARPPAISGPLAADLRKYLRFRHVFRYAYTTELRWKDMAALVISCQDVLDRLEAELKVFLATIEGGS